MDVQEKIPFPAQLTGYIIGSQGRGISSLKQRSAVAKAWVDDANMIHYNRQWAYLHLEGTAQSVDHAKVLLMMRITDAIRQQQVRQQNQVCSQRD